MSAEGPIESLDQRTLSLVKRAARVRKRAYAPYSRYLVGTCLVDEKGKLHTGCNVENASFTAGICSERAAIAKMISRGGKRIKRVVLVASSDEPVFPCGVCLQAINEFGRDAEVVAVNKRMSKFSRRKVEELYPYGFSSKDM